MTVISRANNSGEIGKQAPGLTPASDTGTSSESDDPPRALDGCRQYLLMIAKEVIGPELQAKIGASDLVQDTFVEAQRHLARFRGTSNAEMRAWLRKILECRLSNVRRAYLATGMRALGREVALETLLVWSEIPDDVLASRTPSPSSHAMRSELSQALDRALARLPEHYRQVVLYRHQDELPWDEIGQRMGCSADAARMVWSRAIRQLKKEMENHGPML
jgi:RNA polymerase sigma-70 factor, ECF subfamily